jgi:hypothetical protein
LQLVSGQLRDRPSAIYVTIAAKDFPRLKRILSANGVEVLDRSARKCSKVTDALSLEGIEDLLLRELASVVTRMLFRK